jgi:hypothetical protein
VEPVDHLGKQGGRDLEVEDELGGVADLLGQALVGVVVVVVAVDVVGPRAA